MSTKKLYSLFLSFTISSMTMITACEIEPTYSDPTQVKGDNDNLEVCDDQADNDDDGDVDCDDSDCADEPICQRDVAPEICNDSIDNDGDSYVDCDDSDCNTSRACNGSGSDGEFKPCDPPCGPNEICQDGVCVNEGPHHQIDPCRNVGQECEPGSDTDNLVCAAGNPLDETEITCHNRCTPYRNDADCPSGSLCVGEGRDGFCLRSNCTSPVLSEQECGSIGPNGGQCIIARNDSFLCVEAGTIAAGEACVNVTEENPEPPGCQSGLSCFNGSCQAFCNAGDDASCGEGKDCLPVLAIDDFGVCAAGCPGFDATDECGEGLGCFPISADQGFCFEVGDVPVSEACDEENPCEQFAICQQLDEEDPLMCRAYCDRTGSDGNENCNSDEVCIRLNDVLGACFPGCTAFVEETGCEEEGNLNCIPLNGVRGICRASGDVPGGEPCDGNTDSIFGECAEGFACNPKRDNAGTLTGEGECAAICRTFSSVNDYESGCDEGQFCAIFSSEWGLCEDATSEPLNTGDECDDINQTWCNDDNLCIKTDQTGGPGTCMALCRPQNGDEDCPEAQTCIRGLFEGDRFGVCVP